MAVESERGCGFRKVGGLYLCGEGTSMACDRLPYELDICPTCGGGVKFTRGWTWLDWRMFAGNHHMEETEHLISAKVICKCPEACPVCYPGTQLQPYGLLWVGEQFYSPQSFIQEVIQMGVSRRIAAIPKNLKLGKTWVLFAHKNACGKRRPPLASVVTPPLEAEDVPGVFYAFRPRRLELLLWQSEFTHDKAVELEKKGITPIIIPDGDVDHDPRTSLKPKNEERTPLLFDNLRKSLRGDE